MAATAQVIFKTDPKIKAKAMARAKEKRIPLRLVLDRFLEARSEGKVNFGLQFEEEVHVHAEDLGRVQERRDDDEMMSEEEATQIIDEYRASMPYEERVKDLKKFRAEHMTWLDDVVMSEEDMLKIKNRKRAKVPLIIDLSQPDPVWT